jgi:DNA polymerase (family 10)
LSAPGYTGEVNASEVARALRDIEVLLEVEGGAPFRARAYGRAARAVEATGERLPALVAEGQLLGVPGVGPRLAATIEELVGTGRSALRERLRERLPPGAAELGRVLSLPRMKALSEALDIRTLGELEAACVAGRVRSLKGFGERTERKILADLARLAGEPNGVLLPEAESEATRVLEWVRAHPDVERASVAGELRRRREIVTRLDLVVASARPRAVAEALAGSALVAALLEEGPERVRLRLAGGLELNVLVVLPEAFPMALHRMTGSPAHLAAVEAHARSRGLALDADGVLGGGARVTGRDEADIYPPLGLVPVPPELREGTGEVEAAAAGSLPLDLVTLGDIRGMVHCHTTYSDGKATIEEMARAAERLGMHYLTITDHSPTAAYARGLTAERLRRQWDEIACVQEKVAITLLRGTECDILADGALDYPDPILEQLDIVIASIHNRHRMDAEQMTRRIVTAMRHPCFKIWGHALGRYLLRRPPVACHVEEILDAMAESRAAIEVNGDPHRLDLEPRWIREARKRDLPFVISTDAHSVAALGHLRWGVDMARRGWLGRGQVLNALGPDEFRAAVRP